MISIVTLVTNFESDLDKDRIKGSADQLRGLKELTGKITPKLKS